MDKMQIEKLLKEEQYEAVIELLEDEDYEEYAMLTLCKAYLLSGEEKKAKRLIRKLKMLFPAGEYRVQEDRILAAFEADEIEEYVNGLRDEIAGGEAENADFWGAMGLNTSADSVLPLEQVSEVQSHRAQSINLAEYAAKKRRRSKERTIPESITAYFEDVVGLESVKLELDTFYKKLRLQNERKQNEFNADLIDSTHFAVIGSVGCGKTLVGEIISGLLYDFGIRSNEVAVCVKGIEVFAAYLGDHDGGIDGLFSQAEDATIIIEGIDGWYYSEDKEVEGNFTRAFTDFLNQNRENASIILTGPQEAFAKAEEYSIKIRDALHKVIEIPEYSTLELCEITKVLADRKDLVVHETAQKALMQKIDSERKNPDFMNAVTLSRYIDSATDRMAVRYGESQSDSEELLVCLMPEDFEIEIEEEESLEDLIKQLEDLTGLYAVKEQVKKRIQSVITVEQAEEAGAKRKDGHGSLHMAFIGNPGTGKTTVARIIGKIYQQLGILPRGNQVVEVTRSGLVAQYVGQTAPLVQKRVKEAMGGVLFIDEAYSICKGDSDIFGQEAVDELIAQMENHKDNLLVIMAGYKKEMAEFLKSNPGFASRIRNTIEFEDYTVEEMAEIFGYMVKTNGMTLTEDSKESLIGMLDVRAKEPDFGNARGVRNLFEETTEAMNERIQAMLQSGMTPTKQDYETITKEDIETVAGKTLNKEKTVEELLEELNSLTGLDSVKAKVQEMVDAIQVREYMKSQSIPFNDQQGTLHLVFKGNAGTGKTTVARLIGQIYKKLGVLQKNVFIEVSRKDLVANYAGQTASKVAKKVEEAEGGILFIDEAYTLQNGAQDTLGLEAINTLLPELENRRNSLMVILAGYGEEMDRFLDANQGLASRLSNEVVFEDYTDEELAQIFKYQAKQRQLTLTEGIDDIIFEKIRTVKNATKDFGNARGVRNILDDIEKKKDSRVAAMLRSGTQITIKDVCTLLPVDFDINIEKKDTLEDLLKQLEDLVGLQAVKEQVKKRIQSVEIAEQAEEAGVKRKNGHGSLHMLFVGNPGTGKTTVAKIIGGIYQELGILPRGSHVEEVTRKDLVGQYMGHTAKLVDQCVKKALGGVLFIDEAYALCRGDGDTFGHEAVDELIAQMENHRDNLLVIMAGYKKEMSDFVKSNPGFASRIRNTIEFEDYTIEEMAEIFAYMVENNEMILADDTKDAVLGMLDIKAKEPDFGNARGVRNVYDDVIEAMNERIQNMTQSGVMPTKEQYLTITKEDIETVAGKTIAKEKTVDELLEELNALTGLESVKAKVQEMVDAILVREYMKSQSIAVADKRSTLHLVFKGNAGTGKTTVARLIGQIYQKLGVLEKNVFVEVTRKDLVANYSGQTATKVTQKVNEADGGILFIDEAYTLHNGGHDEFGLEAINALLPELENRRDRLMVILAGYDDKMDRFLDANQGLASRLSNEIIFEDYTDEELVQIFKHQAKQGGLTLAEGMDEIILDKILSAKNSTKDFGNARGVRNVLESIEKKKDSRIAALIRNQEAITAEVARMLLPEDFV